MTSFKTLLGTQALVGWALFGLSALPTLASTPQAVNVLKFADANTLLVGDSKSATVYAYTIAARSNPGAQSAYNLKQFGQQLAKFAKVPMDRLLVRDMAIAPQNKEAYVAFDIKTSKGYQSRVVVVNQGGHIRPFDLARTPHTEVALQDAPTQRTQFWGKTALRSFTITDMDFYQGKVYVSGMSNAEFSSALRVIDFPFKGNKTATASVEIFHAVHNQNETRAPIQTMQIANLGGQEYIIAAYTCTPLVLIPLKDIKDGAHVTGKTIAELGYGNTPIDMIKFKSQDFEKREYEGVILSNRNRSAQFLNLADVSKSAADKGIGYAGMAERAGTPATTLPLSGILQLDDQSDAHIATLRRDADSGNLELVSFLKNIYLRLDDFVSEYDQPGYQYKGDQLGMKDMQNMIINDGGQGKYAKP